MQLEPLITQRQQIWLHITSELLVNQRKTVGVGFEMTTVKIKQFSK